MLFNKPLSAYEQSELNNETRFLMLHNKLGNYKDEQLPDVQGSISRVTWILNGSYGHGAMLKAQQIIANRINGKKGKSLLNAWLAVGRDVTMLVALHDNTEYTYAKITEVWKKQGVDFDSVNAQAAKIIQEYIAESEE